MAKKNQYIRNLQDLVNHFGALDAKNLNRRVYKDTSCGASISVKRKGGDWLHNGQAGWDQLTEIEAFTIQTIVEGSDAEVNSSEMFLPVLIVNVNRAVERIENEAQRLWDEANDDDIEDVDEFDEDHVNGPTHEPYQGPKTVTVDAMKAMRLFMEWHRDENMTMKQVRDYAHRLMTRLAQEAKK